MKAISLFSGAGGMDVGVKRAGFDIVAGAEFDHYACDTYALNHPESRLFRGDIRDHIKAICAFKGIDLVFGGPPCQGFSVAGKMDPDDPRSKLVFTFCDLVEGIEPNAFIMENVKSLGTLAKFEAIRSRFIQRMEGAGYTVSMHVLNACDFGIPQSRERVFFIGTKNGSTVTDGAIEAFYKSAVTVRDAIAHLGPPGTRGNPHQTTAKITLAKNPVLRKSPYAGMLFNGQGRPLNPDTWASTLPASMGGNRTPIIDNNQLYNNAPGAIEVLHQKLMSGVPSSALCVPSSLRRLTITEAAILQTFPSDYEFCGPQSKVFSQIGNAVPCDLAFVVASATQKALKPH